MKDCLKLWKRDRVILLLLLVAIVGAAFISITHELKFMGQKLFDLKYFEEQRIRIESYLETHPEARNDVNTFWDIQDLLDYILITTDSMIVMFAFFALAIKMGVQEKASRVVLNRMLPIKSRNQLTYQYICGILLAGIPLVIPNFILKMHFMYVETNTVFEFSGVSLISTYMIKAMIAFVFYYSIFILCRRLSNNIPGTILMFVVAFGFMDLCLSRTTWNQPIIIETSGFEFWMTAVVAIVLIIFLTYLADSRKDDARNGCFAYRWLHYLIMGMVFCEVLAITIGGYDVIPQVPRVLFWLIDIICAAAVTAGLHYVTRPKTYE